MDLAGMAGLDVRGVGDDGEVLEEGHGGSLGEDHEEVTSGRF